MFMNSIRLKNFRCFREEQTARLAPLTLLVGENSTGKTSFLAMIRALWTAAYEHRIPDFKEEPYDLGSFDDIAHYRGGRGGRAHNFEAGFEFSLPRPGGAWVGQIAVTFTKNGTAPVPKTMRLSTADGSVWMEHDFLGKGAPRLRAGTPNGDWGWNVPEVFWNHSGDSLPPFHVGFLVMQIAKRANLASSDRFPPGEQDREMISDLSQFIPHIFGNRDGRLYASAPVRSKPRRTYDPSRVRWDPDGDYIPMYLTNLYYEDVKQWNDLKVALEMYGRDSGLFDDISVKPLGKKQGDPFQIHVRKKGRKAKGPARNLIDVGYGVSQALPVIVELLRNDPPSVCLLQQPEVHLHPSAQAALGSLLSKAAGEKRQLIVETHSDHLMDRVRMDVRDGKTALKPEDVSILYFEREDLDVRVHYIKIDKLGNIRGAPRGYREFFMEETRRQLGL